MRVHGGGGRAQEEVGRVLDVAASDGVDDRVEGGSDGEVGGCVCDVRDYGNDWVAAVSAAVLRPRGRIPSLLSSAASCFALAAERVWPYTICPARTKACAIGRPMNPVALGRSTPSEKGVVPGCEWDSPEDENLHGGGVC